MTQFSGQSVAAVPAEMQGRQSTRLLSLRRMASLSVALLTVVACASGYGVYSVVRGGPFSVQLVVFSACGMLVGVAIVCLLIGRQSAERCLRQIEQQLRALTRDERLERVDGPIPEELRPVMTTLQTYVEQVAHRVDRLRVQKKELNIQKRVADAERKHTEAIIFSISDAVLVIDSFGELILANTAAERLFDFTLNQAKRSPIERVVKDETLIALIGEARCGGEETMRQELEYDWTRDGKVGTYKVTLSSVFDSSGEAQGVVAVFHDMTRDREMAQIKTDFVSAVSHELKTPLSSIRAYIEMLLDGEVEDEYTRRDFYHIIDSETQRLARLVENVLDISRIESGIADLQRRQINAVAVVDEAVGVLMPQASEKRITLENECGNGTPMVYADRDLLYQAILNLVSNAIKYTNEGGHVRVQTNTQQTPGYFTIAVIDNGIGIKADEVSRVFDKFYRTDQGAETAKGTGLGLNLVRQIVETVHQGSISVASEYGVGTTVTVRLPIMTG